MRYDLDDLLAIYAEQNSISIDEAFEWYIKGRIPKVTLLEAYLEEEELSVIHLHYGASLKH